MLFLLFFSLIPFLVASAIVGLCSVFIWGLSLFIGGFLWHWKGLGLCFIGGLIAAPWAHFFSHEPIKASVFLLVALTSSAIAIFFSIGKGKWKKQLFHKLDEMGIGLFLADHQVQLLEKEAFHREREENIEDKQLLALLKEETQKVEALERENALLEGIVSTLSSSIKSVRIKKAPRETGQRYFPF